ncbi:LPXTG cell wall anchor domain-containing protein [Streptomyces sp. NPDC058682]|uniref:LPXTG cell wall anchor domain-containing protein n=1 Tax=unclassified Streptomyces TaxID=2593676 RepID=UPI00225AA6D8|nr:LPXTG cell wall anchor domain-containing protein [Streptomyces sp. NBC_01214]MCX4806516.1 LPXTG cell wall anchor domain-containing protein [Streptomyces sp. NBC_01214]
MPGDGPPGRKEILVMALVTPQARAWRTPRAPRAARILRAARTSRAPLTATVLTGAGLVLLPWVVVLAKTMPQTSEVSNWSTAWIGLDLMLAAGLTGTGALLRRRDPRASPVAAATAALLVMDAWFDVTTSAGTGGQGMALLLAAGAELPLAVACAVVAARRPR